MAGIEEQLEPSAPTVGNGYLPDTRHGPPLHKNMPAAIAALRDSACARDWLGERFVETFSATREAQCKSFVGKSLIDERRRFFELG